MFEHPQPPPTDYRHPYFDLYPEATRELFRSRQRPEQAQFTTEEGEVDEVGHGEATQRWLGAMATLEAKAGYAGRRELEDTTESILTEAHATSFWLNREGSEQGVRQELREQNNRYNFSEAAKRLEAEHGEFLAQVEAVAAEKGPFSGAEFSDIVAHAIKDGIIPPVMFSVSPQRNGARHFKLFEGEVPGTFESPSGETEPMFIKRRSRIFVSPYFDDLAPEERPNGLQLQELVFKNEDVPTEEYTTNVRKFTQVMESRHSAAEN